MDIRITKKMNTLKGLKDLKGNFIEIDQLFSAKIFLELKIPSVSF